MFISLIGMSNIGKSFCAGRLAAVKGFRHIDCDALIEEKLGPAYAESGLNGIHGVAEWMGLPADPKYKKNSARYIACERDVLKSALADLQSDREGNAVVDTTGSVIYTGEDILDSLRSLTTVVYLEASDKHVGDLYKSFIAHPKPVIWGDSYVPAPGETEDQTLKRCYPELLRLRARRYKELAHVTIPFERLLENKNSVADFVLDCARANDDGLPATKRA